MTYRLAVAILLASCLHGQSGVQNTVNSFDAIRFLEGTWNAKTEAGPTGTAVTGAYSIRQELGGHILARHSSSDACKGPADFDCDHHDLLYVYQEAAGQPLKGIYFDNEGHVIHYDIFKPAATTIEFISDRSQPGPRFQLVYELKNEVMSGKFQMQMPGQTDWKSYLEWSGRKK